MSITYGPEYFRQKAKEQRERNKLRGFVSTTVTMPEKHRKQCQMICRAWREGLKVEFRINDGKWQGG